MRALFLAAAIPQFFGVIGHSTLGEREIFPKLFKGKTGLDGPALRILRATWHVASLSFALQGIILMALAFKSGLLTREERIAVHAISGWNLGTGILCVGYWGRDKPQGWLFIGITTLLQIGLLLKP